MTPSASPYAVFKAEEWVSAIAQPIGIGQCLRLTPKKLTPIGSSIKKKSSNSLRNGFSKKHVQLSFSWHISIFVIPRYKFHNTFFMSCLSSSYSSWRTFDFKLSSQDAATRQKLFDVMNLPYIFNRSTFNMILDTIFDLYVRFIGIIV